MLLQAEHLPELSQTLPKVPFKFSPSPVIIFVELLWQPLPLAVSLQLPCIPTLLVYYPLFPLVPDFTEEVHVGLVLSNFNVAV